jgi:ATP-dependent protease ClpP protease subunit
MEPTLKRPKFCSNKPPLSSESKTIDLTSLLGGAMSLDKLPGLGDELGDGRVEVIDNNIYFYTDVSTSSCFQLIKALRRLDIECQEKALRENLENTHINLHIHSYGGDLFASFAVIDVIRTMKTPVYSYIEGMAASAATIISVVCDRRYIYKYSYMLIHQLSGGMWGKFQEMEDDFKSSKDLMTDIKNIYVQHTNLKKRELKDILKHDLWWNSAKCLENGLVDEVL